MLGTLWIVAWFGMVGWLAYQSVPRYTASSALVLACLLTLFLSPVSWIAKLVITTLTTASLLFTHARALRIQYITAPLMKAIAKTMPQVSETEQLALDAGDVWWEGKWFSGKPQWADLNSIPAPRLTEEEQAFLDGPVEKVTQMTDDWEITQYSHDLPESVWQFLKQEGFFGLIIPKAYGGKAFSAMAHAQIVQKLASKSVTLSTSVAVPNTLGPAELLMHYGTEAQRAHYLPRLARGEDIPCFGLTTTDAGSDAGAIADKGIICYGEFDGEEVLGIRLNFEKRYITMAPIATVVGLAFKLYDPDNLFSDKTELGITCALIPSTTPGMKIGRRHLPVTIPFQNGPISGRDVFIPMDWIIGGPKMAGEGWRMLMECLSCGRGITLPSSSTGGAKFGLLATGAYARIRKQFKVPVCQFEGIKDALARIVGFTYLADATRTLTVAAIAAGKKPAIASAISKYHVTEMGRQIANDAMDIHGGKGIMMGPRNYLARAYQSSPISITVEGANILTRNLIIFGQGAIRCHPFLKEEIDAVQNEQLDSFDELLVQHTGFGLQNVVSVLFHGFTFGRFGSHPTTCVPKLYQQYSHAAAAFALTSDLSLALLGGHLKVRETLSARLGDMLSYLYMGSAALKRFADQGEPAEDVPVVEWCSTYALANFYRALIALLDNYPNKAIGRTLRTITMPFGRPVRHPSDRLTHEIASLVTEPTATRQRLIDGIYDPRQPESHANILEQALRDSLAAEPVEKKIHQGIKQGILTEDHPDALLMEAQRAQWITPEEADMVAKAQASRRYVIAVDDFAPESLVLRPVNEPNTTGSEASFNQNSWLDN